MQITPFIKLHFLNKKKEQTNVDGMFVQMSMHAVNQQIEIEYLTCTDV